MIFGTLSIGGCVGHSMRPKLNLKDGQISKSNEHTDDFKSSLTFFFLTYFLISVTAKLKKKHFALGHCVLHQITTYLLSVFEGQYEMLLYQFCS